MGERSSLGGGDAGVRKGQTPLPRWVPACRLCLLSPPAASGSSSSWCWWGSRWGPSTSPTVPSPQVRNCPCSPLHLWVNPQHRIKPRAGVGFPAAVCPCHCQIPIITTFNCFFSSPQVWFYFGVVGSFLFILIQLVLLIDFAHSWSQLWLRNAGESNAKGWYAGWYGWHRRGFRDGDTHPGAG